MVRGKSGIGTSTLTTQGTVCHHGAQALTIVEWTMASKSATLFKVLRALICRQQSMLSGPNLKSMSWILMQLFHIWAKWSQRKMSPCNLSILQKLEVNWWGLKWWPSWGKSPRQSGTPWWKQKMQVRKLCKQQASSLPWSKLLQMLRLLLLGLSLGLILNLWRVMSRRKRERLLKNQHGGETEGLLSWLARHWEASTKNPAYSFIEEKNQHELCWWWHYDRKSVQTVHLSAHNILAVVKTKIELDSHA